VLKPPSNYPLRKAFELLYDFFFVLKYALVCDVVYVLGIYGGAAQLFPRLLGKEVIVNTDGLEWERAKYSVLERSIIILYYAIALNLASKIVVDNKELKRYIGARHHSKICYIPYGATYQEPLPWDEGKLRHCISEQLDKGALEHGKYWLVVSRLEPENNIDLIVEGFVQANPKYPLVIVGDFTSQRYRQRVRQQASNGNTATVHFLGAIYDSGTLWMLRQHCLAYIHGHSVGGTNPSLLEAMISKNLVVCHDNRFNREVCGPFACYFLDSIDLSALVTSIEKNAGALGELRSEVQKRAVEAYSWDSVTTSYDKLFKREEKQARVHREPQAQVSQESEP